MQAHVRVWEENKLELEEKNNAYWNNFAVNGARLQVKWGEVSRWYSQEWFTIA